VGVKRTKKLKGKKFDKGKPKISMIPREAWEEEARVLEYGATKYGRDNYKDGMDWTRVLDASLRHILAFSSGENVDPETGISHLGHAKANLSMLLYYIKNDVGNDDR
jgi:Domain of unknown function (DUF5664)